MPVNIDQLRAIVREAGALIRSAQMSPEEIRSKDGHRNYVTRFDVMVQDHLEQQLRELAPDYGFVAEEQDSQDYSHTSSFIVDPIDGTSNFIFGIPQYCISVAVVEDGEVRQGVVYNPALDEMYWAESGKGSFLNGAPIVNPDLPLEQTLFGVGTSPYNAAYREQSVTLMNALLPVAIDIRRLGSAALDLCYVANGRQGGYFEFEINPWDIAAGMLIAREAGARVTTLDGHEPPLDRTMSIFAAGQQAYEQFMAIYQEAGQ